MSTSGSKFQILDCIAFIFSSVTSPLAIVNSLFESIKINKQIIIIIQNYPIKNLHNLFFVLFSKRESLFWGNEDSNVVPHEKHHPDDFSSIFNFDLQFGQISI